MNKKFEGIDKVDREILSILVKDATVSYAEIAKKILVSPGTVHVRMRIMKEAGLIKGATLVLDHNKLGYDITAFVGIIIEKSSSYNDIIKIIKRIPEIVEANFTTGIYSILLKIVCKNSQHLREILNDQLRPIEGIQRTETFLALEESIKRPVEIFEK